jgi:hypothetical protein
MRKFLPLLSLVAVASCSDDGLHVVYNEPAVTIHTPYEAQQFDEGEAIHFTGVVEDDTPAEDLIVEWISSIDEVLPDFDPPDADGNVEVTTASLSVGTHVITLRAIDKDNEQGEDEVTIEVIDVPDLPSIEVIHPAADENALDGYPFVFHAEVSDNQDPAELLEVTLSSDITGLVCFMDVDGSGNATCSAELPIAQYMLTFIAEDTDGNIARAQAAFAVVSPDDYDFDGDGYSVNGGDCNDSNDTIYPGAPEICDGLDNDCSEATGIDVGSECYDDDGDGYCEAPPCMNTENTEIDCDDNSADIAPYAEEVLDGIDNDCDGFIDEGTCAYDDDGDGFCECPPCENTTVMREDCDDDNYDVNPDENEVCGDGIDNDCDGQTNQQNATGCHDYYYDGDGDTYGVAGATQCWCEDGAWPYTGLNDNDCYDSNADAHPGQTSYFTADRGDSRFDYDCNGSEAKEYNQISGGCDWDLVYISCECNGEGWERSVPACGDAGLWIGDCSGTYDVICYALCIISSNPATCLSRCSATCDPDYDSFAQGCR